MVKGNSVIVRDALSGDLKKIEGLLRQEGLPFQDIHQHLPNFIVIEEDNEIIGVGGMELYQSSSLIRSIAIVKEYRGIGLSIYIFESLKNKAINSGVTKLFLLTQTAESYFTKLGFSKISRESAPSEIQGTKQFSGLCPSSATLMSISLLK